MTKLFRTVEELNRSVHSTGTAQLELKSSVDRLDQRLAVIEQEHQQPDRVESNATMLKSTVTGLTISQQEVAFNCSCLDQQTDEFDKQKTEFSSLKSKVMHHQEMFDQEPEQRNSEISR